MAQKILVVDEDPVFQAAIEKALGDRGFEVHGAASVAGGLELVEPCRYDLVILDASGPAGLDAIASIKDRDPAAEVIATSPGGSPETVAEALCRGARDHFSKPFSVPEMLIVARRLLRRASILAEARRRGLASLPSTPMERIVGETESIHAVKALIGKIAPLDTTALVAGESGTGKELVADVIHARSRRASGPFIKVNCAAIPENLLESELFGYEKGAFTGAFAHKPGKFELAHRGTIFLDEVGDLSLAVQAKLLRVVEQKQIERLGGTRTVTVDARIIAATNQDLPEMIRRKAFREDLYYRLNVACIHTPPLRERMADLPLLAMHILRDINLKIGSDLQSLSPGALELLFSCRWPGNVRELANTLERSAILASGTVLTARDVWAAFPRESGAVPPLGPVVCTSLRQMVRQMERSLIVQALSRTGGVQCEAARLLGVTAKNLWKKIHEHRIEVARPAHAPTAESAWPPEARAEIGRA